MSCLRLLLRRRRRHRRRRLRSPAENTPPEDVELLGPLEDDDLLGEILLRLPPQPSSLPRAALVCKRWRSLASDPGFVRRFRRHHRRNPPLLGFFVREGDFVPTLEAPNQVPPGRLSLQRGQGDRFLSLGCRHGLVLIFDIKPNQMLVCDPITGDQHRLAIPPGIATHAEKTTINGAVLRAGGDAHFQVILAVNGNDDKQHERVLACVYSSETGLWGDLISTRLPSEVPRSGCPTLVSTVRPAVLVGNSLYWLLAGNYIGIIEFNLEEQSLAVIQAPVHMLQKSYFLIMRAEDGGLGLLYPTDSSIQLWKRKIDCDGVASWTLERTIELDKLLSLKPRQVDSVSILGYAEENNVIYLCACAIVFMVHLESLQFKKLYETCFSCHYHPFECVYTTGIGGGHDAADLLHHS
ncbi:hypothetical protein ACQ4PT_013632 [Festuca glaucescens]